MEEFFKKKTQNKETIGKVSIRPNYFKNLKVPKLSTYSKKRFKNFLQFGRGLPRKREELKKEGETLSKFTAIYFGGIHSFKSTKVMDPHFSKGL